MSQLQVVIIIIKMTRKLWLSSEPNFDVEPYIHQIRLDSHSSQQTDD